MQQMQCRANYEFLGLKVRNSVVNKSHLLVTSGQRFPWERFAAVGGAGRPGRPGIAAGWPTRRKSRRRCGGGPHCWSSGARKEAETITNNKGRRSRKVMNRKKQVELYWNDETICRKWLHYCITFTSILLYITLYNVSTCQSLNVDCSRPRIQACIFVRKVWFYCRCID